MFDSYKYVYNRNMIPYCFNVTLSEAEKLIQQQIIAELSQNYVSLASQPGVEHNSMMPYGITFGEFAMFLILKQNKRRQNQKSPPEAV